tara:strand:+ start:1359 stop:1628 length:270 start_codon:yes stop_codon:yes gene_type:complete
MTLAEFELRAYAYRRQQQWDWAKFRSVSFWAVRAFNIAPKSIPKKLTEMMVLPFVDENSDKGGLSEDQINAFKAAQERYLKQKEKNAVK